MKYFSFLISFLFASTFLSAQSLDEELGFIYVKAEYLLDTDRYEESILEFSKIVAIEPGFKDVLYKRAIAKYALAAYKGVKQDLLQSFEFTGLSSESILLYGKALDELGESESASKTLNIASKLYPDDKKASKYKDPEEEDSTHKDEGDHKNTEETIKEEVKKLEDKISSILDDLLPDSEEDEEAESESGGNDDNGESENTETSNKKDDDFKTKVYIPDNSINEIYIDEDLTLEIKNGLGNRKVLEQPNILILSESAGDVAVDICVNRNGKVTSAEYNQRTSNLDIQSLISLAVRKSKEFWFEKSDRKETCGTIIFHISGRN